MTALVEVEGQHGIAPAPAVQRSLAAFPGSQTIRVRGVTAYWSKQIVWTLEASSGGYLVAVSTKAGDSQAKATANQAMAAFLQGLQTAR
jgi:hypothetical protein